MSERPSDKTEFDYEPVGPKERRDPDLINPSRKRRIAAGAGVQVADVNRLLKQFEQSRKMMKQMSSLMGGRGRRGGFKLPF